MIVEILTEILCVLCRVSTIKKFPADMMDILRILIIQDHHYFLLLSRTEQELLVDKMAQRMVSRSHCVCCSDLWLGKRKGRDEKPRFRRCVFCGLLAGHVHRAVHRGGVSCTGHHGTICEGWSFHSARAQLLLWQSGFPSGTLLQQQQDGHGGWNPARTCHLRVMPITRAEGF